MNIKKYITVDNAVKVGLGLLTVGQFLLSGKKEAIDMANLKADVVKEVLDELAQNK